MLRFQHRFSHIPKVCFARCAQTRPRCKAIVVSLAVASAAISNQSIAIPADSKAVESEQQAIAQSDYQRLLSELRTAEKDLETAKRAAATKSPLLGIAYAELPQATAAATTASEESTGVTEFYGGPKSQDFAIYQKWKRCIDDELDLKWTQRAQSSSRLAPFLKWLAKEMVVSQSRTQAGPTSTGGSAVATAPSAADEDQALQQYLSTLESAVKQRRPRCEDIAKGIDIPQFVSDYVARTHDADAEVNIFRLYIKATEPAEIGALESKVSTLARQLDGAMPDWRRREEQAMQDQRERQLRRPNGQISWLVLLTTTSVIGAAIWLSLTRRRPLGGDDKGHP